MSIDPAKLAAVNAKAMSIVATIEHFIPDGVPIPGLFKLNLALKLILKWDATLVGNADDVKSLISQAKSEYNEIRSEVRSLFAKPAVPEARA